MSKYVVFSFDDGRSDTFSNAFPVLSRYGFTATVNIATDFINNPQNYKNFKSAGNMAMTWDEILILQENGWEIASHSHTHVNDGEDVRISREELQKHGIHTDVMGFASPNSVVDRNNYLQLKENMPAEICYMRSGLQVKREGLVYAGLTLLNRWIKSPKLLCLLNNRCKLKMKPTLTNEPMLSVGISADMPVKSVISLLKRLSENECYILMFHSILSKREDVQKVDDWWWDIEKFEKLCGWLADQKDYQVLTTKQLMQLSLQTNEDDAS